MKDTDKTEEYRNSITVHLVRICGDVEHIKEKVNENNKHLISMNGRLRLAENNVTAIKTIGTTLTVVVGIILTWLGISK